MGGSGEVERFQHDKEIGVARNLDAWMRLWSTGGCSSGGRLQTLAASRRFPLTGDRARRGGPAALVATPLCRVGRGTLGRRGLSAERTQFFGENLFANLDLCQSRTGVINGFHAPSVRSPGYADRQAAGTTPRSSGRRSETYWGAGSRAPNEPNCSEGRTLSI
jgi:hypothetical protein